MSLCRASADLCLSCGPDTPGTDANLLPYPVLPPADATQVDIVGRDQCAMTPEDRALALLLITAWTVRTGRVLHPVPISGLVPPNL